MTTNKKINILEFICSTGFYGAERWILALAKHLPRDWVRCDLAITLENDSNDLDLIKKYRQECGEAFEVPMSHRFDITVVNRLVKLIKQRDIDIIHTHGYKSDILGLLAARKAGIKNITTPHGYDDPDLLKLKLFNWLGSKSMQFATAVAPLSPQLVKDSKRAGVKQDKIHYIQNGVDLSEVDAQRQKENPFKNSSENSSEKRIGFIGQMISRKNIFNILDIFNELATEKESVRLILVGDGELRSELEAYSEKLSNRKKIDFLGFRQDRLELLQSFDLFVMTSKLEGIPRCLMEACAMGIPVAAYNIPGIDQLVTHEATGLLADPGDKKTLKSYWEKLLFDKVFAQTLAENARNNVNEHYSAQRMANEYIDLFKKLQQ